MLGQKRAPRNRLHPDNYVDGPATLAEAYSELSRHAFAAWVRLMLVPTDELRRGVLYVSKVLGYSERGGKAVLDELEQSGYIGIDRIPGKRSTPVLLLRRAKLPTRGNHFVRI